MLICRLYSVFEHWATHSLTWSISSVYEKRQLSWRYRLKQTVLLVVIYTGKPPVSIRRVLLRDPLGEHETTCLLCTGQTIAPLQIVEWFVMRWQVEVTYEEARRRLGVETQRQWSDKAIARTTPALLGVFSWITLVAHQSHLSGQLIVVRQSAWYTKTLPTFSDALALVRQQRWLSRATFQTSGLPPDIVKVPHSF